MDARRLRARIVPTIAVLCVAVLVPTARPVAAVEPPGDVVVQWNAAAVGASLAAGQGPTVGVLQLSIVHGAMYDAVIGIEGGYEPYIGVPAAADANDSSVAAAAKAARDVLASLYPSQVGTFDTLYASTTSGIPEPAKSGGAEVGAQAATAMLALRANDGRFSAFTVVQGDEAGEWRSTGTNPITGLPQVEAAPWVGNVTPFLVPSAARLRSQGPNALTSDEYTADFIEVKEIGSLTSTTRTADQTDAAIFWQANGAGLWNAIFRQLATGQDLDIVEASRLFVMTNMAGADGAIGCWNDKYYWNFWRPETAIRLAGTDDNPATVADPTWLPLLAGVSPPHLSSPPFPEHPSGHSCVSTAIGLTLRNFFGTDWMAFSTFSSLSGTTREFTRFSQAVKEILNARVWGGIHFRAADEQGATIGRKVARYARLHYFEPVE